MKKILSLLIAVTFIFTLTGCGESSGDDDKTITIGATSSPHGEILNDSVKQQLKEKGYTLKVKIFDDYTLPNASLDKGELDANYFQHTPYLEQEIKDHDYKLTAVSKIHFEPFGIYSNTTTKPNENFSVNDVKEGDKIVVPDDTTNEARALQLLASKGIITLKDGVGLKATKDDITKNPKNVEIVEVAADSCAASLEDAAYVIINGNYALAAKVTNKIIVHEDPKSDAANTYANLLVVQTKNKNSKKTKALKAALTSEETKKYINDKYDGTVVPVF